jgi:hypothetical protein
LTSTLSKAQSVGRPRAIPTELTKGKAAAASRQHDDVRLATEDEHEREHGYLSLAKTPSGGQGD